MNRTQKGAWFNLAGTLLCLALGISIMVEIFVFQRLPEGIGRFWGFLAFWLIVPLAIIFMRKKQSPAEPDSDERDELIKKRAVLVGFVSVWVLLAAASAIPRFVVGVKGSIPVWLLAFINLGVFLIALLVYSVAILVQYGWRGKKTKIKNVKFKIVELLHDKALIDPSDSLRMTREKNHE